MPRTHTGSVDITSPAHTVLGSAMWACSRPPWARGTSSHRSQRTCIHPTGPCAVHGAAGPVVGGLNPFRTRIKRPRALRTPSGRRGRPRGRTGSSDGSPGPQSCNEGGPERAGVPFRPSSLMSAPPVMEFGGASYPENHVMRLSSPVAALARACLGRVAYGCDSFLDGSVALLAQLSSAS